MGQKQLNSENYKREEEKLEIKANSNSNTIGLS